MDAVVSPPRARENRVAVVTGASSGIGRATAIAFAAAGFRVVLAARGVESLEIAAQDCRTAGADALAVPTDVTDARAVKALADAAIERFGGIDVWVNNVGVGAVGRFDEVPIDAHRRVIESNLIGHLNGAHAVVPHFRRRRRGTLVNVISIGGWLPTPLAVAYGASKYGVRGFGEALRAELSTLRHVHVCDVAPTFVDTPGIRHGANYTGKRVKPSPPLVDPRQVARAVVALADRPRPLTFVGSVAAPARIANAIAPELVGAVAMRLFDWALGRATPARTTTGNLFAPSKETEIDGGYRSPAPRVAAAGGVAVALLAVGWLVLRPRR